jgi:hypothetical protein
MGQRSQRCLCRRRRRRLPALRRNLLAEARLEDQRRPPQHLGPRQHLLRRRSQRHHLPVHRHQRETLTFSMGPCPLRRPCPAHAPDAPRGPFGASCSSTVAVGADRSRRAAPPSAASPTSMPSCGAAAAYRSRRRRPTLEDALAPRARGRTRQAPSRSAAASSKSGESCAGSSVMTAIRPAPSSQPPLSQISDSLASTPAGRRDRLPAGAG